ncbi:hypothetical protein C8T65DRAFT_741577 [Cerioporus squamosus]|nr:hypothetical protein C8T65DRAFT_741577 [Cerioporus squamosus]
MDVPNGLRGSAPPAANRNAEPRPNSNFEEEVGLDVDRLLAEQLAAQREQDEHLRHSTPAPVVINPLTRRVSMMGQPMQQTATLRAQDAPQQRYVIHPMMPKPRDGFPTLHFSNPDSVAAGSDMNYVRDMKKVSGEKTVIGVRIPKVKGVPPENMVRSIRGRMEQVITEVTGETGFRIGLPRLPTVRRQGEPHPVLWSYQ